ncbi:CopG family antitoxin [Beijerinckia sp. L45]|uniref:CopG family antitoxin n=1 Tax=Beijerinckia sp. L45 TaxID=1641855 RepID=UPI00131E4B13|nr:CopG family antitoxin [Beijerinckia sp. L45]
MKKKLPTLERDAEAETFVSTLDLTEYDLSAMVPVQFTVRPSAVPLSVDLPKHLVDEARTKATDSGVPLQDFIQTAIARAVLE